MWRDLGFKLVALLLQCLRIRPPLHLVAAVGVRVIDSGNKKQAICQQINEHCTPATLSQSGGRRALQTAESQVEGTREMGCVHGCWSAMMCSLRFPLLHTTVTSRLHGPKEEGIHQRHTQRPKAARQ
jgi:hypothetical protein